MRRPLSEERLESAQRALLVALRTLADVSAARPPPVRVLREARDQCRAAEGEIEAAMAAVENETETCSRATGER